MLGLAKNAQYFSGGGLLDLYIPPPAQLGPCHLHLWERFHSSGSWEAELDFSEVMCSKSWEPSTPSAEGRQCAGPGTPLLCSTVEAALLDSRGRPCSVSGSTLGGGRRSWLGRWLLLPGQAASLHWKPQGPTTASAAAVGQDWAPRQSLGVSWRVHLGTDT